MKTQTQNKTLMVLLLIFIANFTFAQQPGLWTGVSDDDWGNYQNWDDGNVPDNNDDVVIPASCGNYPYLLKHLVIGSAYVAGDIYRCKSLDIQSGGQIISASPLTVNGTMNIDGLYLYDEEYLSGTHVVNSGGSITVSALGSLFVGQYGYIPDLKQDLIINSGGSVSTAGYFNVNDCIIVHSGASFTMTGGVAYAMGYEGNYNSTYPGSFYIESGASGGISGGQFYLQGKEVSGYYALSINDASFDFSGTNHLYLHIQGDQGAPYPDYSVYAVNGVSFNDVTVTNMGSVTTLASNMQVDGDFIVDYPSCFTISSGCTLTIDGDFTMKSELILGTDFYSSLLEEGQLNVTGTTKVQWAIEGDKWHFIASPVANETANIFSGMYMMGFTESSNGWYWITSLSQALTPMEGYALFLDASWWQYVYFTGAINNGNYGSSNNLSMQSQGWNMVGNPYPSAIDWDATTGWTKTNVNNAIYTEYNGNWASYVNGVGTNGGSRYIPPCHGFFVQANANPATLMMSNDVRQHKKPIYMKTNPANVIRLQASAVDTAITLKTDEAIIRFDSNAGTGFDGDFDAHKLFASDNLIPQIYTSSYELSINTLPVPATVLVKFQAGISGNYRLSATETGNFNYITLKDLFTGAETDLVASDYSFAYNPGDSTDRFVLLLEPTSETDFQPSSEEKISVYGYNKQVIIDIPELVILQNENPPVATLINQTGQVIRKKFLYHSGRNILPVSEGGIYLVKVDTGSKSLVQKIFIH